MPLIALAYWETLSHTITATTACQRLQGETKGLSLRMRIILCLCTEVVNTLLSVSIIVMITVILIAALVSRVVDGCHYHPLPRIRYLDGVVSTLYTRLLWFTAFLCKK